MVLRIVFLSLLWFVSPYAFGCTAADVVTHDSVYTKNDTIVALQHIRNRKVKVKLATLVIGVGLVWSFSNKDNDSNQAANSSVVVLASIGILENIYWLRKFRKGKFDLTIQNYRNGTPLPANIKGWIRIKDLQKAHH